MPNLSSYNYTQPITASPTSGADFMQHNNDMASITSLVLGGIGLLLAVATLAVTYLQLRHHMKTSLGETQSRYNEMDESESITVVCLSDLHGEISNDFHLNLELMPQRNQQVDRANEQY